MKPRIRLKENTPGLGDQALKCNHWARGRYQDSGMAEAILTRPSSFTPSADPP